MAQLNNVYSSHLATCLPVDHAIFFLNSYFKNSPQTLNILARKCVGNSKVVPNKQYRFNNKTVKNVTELWKKSNEYRIYDIDRNIK